MARFHPQPIFEEVDRLVQLRACNGLLRPAEKGLLLYRLGRCSEAVTYLKRAEQLEPDRHEPSQVLKKAERC